MSIQAEDRAHGVYVVTCDEASRLKAALKRFAEAVHLSRTYPGVSRLEETALLACEVEIIEALGLACDSPEAVANLLPDLRIPAAFGDDHKANGGTSVSSNDLR